MNRLFLLALCLTSVPVFANFEDEHMDKEQKEMIEEKMQKEEAPTSTSLGGSRGGSLEIEKSRDAKEQHDFDKQKQMYEYEEKYRRGL